jgi:hypothetical protein
MSFRLIKLAALASTLVLAACGGGSDGPPDKPLASIWTNTQTGATLDLQGAQVGGATTIALFPPSAVRCLCTLTIIGTQTGGSFAITDCIVSPFNAGTNNQCTALNSTGNYSKSPDVLTLTNNTSGDVGTYR